MSASREIGQFGRFRVLHRAGSSFVTVAGDHHGEQLDLAGWRSRLAMYRHLRARRGGRFAGFYENSERACVAAVKVLQGDLA